MLDSSEIKIAHLNGDTINELDTFFWFQAGRAFSSDLPYFVDLVCITNISVLSFLFAEPEYQVRLFRGKSWIYSQ